VAYIWTPSGAQSWTGKEPGLGVDGLAAGVYEYSLVVKDSLGLLSDAVTVTLTVVEEVVAVPDLAGMTEDEAKKALEDAGLVAGAATQEASEEVAGSVTRTEPEAGMGVAPGSTVEIWVAAEATVETPGEETPGEETPGEETPGEETPGEDTPGEETPGDETPGEETPGEETPGEETPGEETPGEETPGEETPGEETPAGKVEVPDVGGVSLAQARKAIEKAGLKVGQVTLKPGEGTPGQVISQTPFAGAEVDRGASVELDVGAEKKILVPDVKGLSRPQAAMRIRAAGLRYKVTYNRPAAGVEVKAGTQVVLLVRRALVLVIVPSIDGLVRSMAEKRLAGAGLVLGRVEEKVEKGGGGLVFHQNPASGTKVKKGSSVDVKIKVEPAPVDVKVPDVRGLKLSEAGRILTEAGLRVGITPFEKTNEHKPGLVIRQSPAPGATAKSGSDVRLIIAQAAPDLVPVPDLQGKTLEEARKVLEKEGLALGVVTRAISSEGKPEGTVLKQSPMVGREVPKGSKVHLVVASKTPTKVKVPKLLGLTLVEATKALAAAGLKLGSVNYEEATGRPKDQVTSQSSDPKTEVVPGTVVSIAISRGKVERVRVPVLLRKSAKEAEEILKKLGLVLGKVEEGPRYGKEIVVGQTPAPMKSVLKGSRVDIIVTTRK
jgi:beta-lactam-binding protein with PASTA domain